MEQKTVLIVEDDGILAIQLRNMLVGLGYGVSEPVATGEAAIAAVATERPDLVLMDIQLAGVMDGIAAAGSIHSDDDVPVVFLTGYSQDPLIQRAKATVPYGYLIKPVSQRELAATIETTLYRHTLYRQLKEHREALQKAHDELELRVQERTADLLLANESLRGEMEERMRVEATLRKSESRWRSYLENAPYGVFITDKKGKCLQVNPEACRITGYANKELLSMSIPDLLPPDSPAEDMAGLADCRKNGRTHVECQYINKTGERRWCSVAAVKLSDTRFLGFVSDISQRMDAEEKIHELSHLLLQAQENERQLISCELHDCIAQNLSVLKIDCASLYNDPSTISPAIREKLAASGSLLSQTIAAVRNLAYDLRLPGLEDMGLVKALEIYCDEASENGKLKVDFQSTGMSVMDLDGNTEIHIYRLIQEALNNIRKHADAGQATILLLGSYPNVILRIEDNGRGFDVEAQERISAATKRMGIRSMQERVRLLQGQVTIHSQPMKGTRIFIKIPLCNPAPKVRS
ncbi:MAG: PAS domain S-box protein [Deltaproteobacteria bacterium]|nr:PAS domain S-box protein [Deltaproteobacteria bacterium]